MHSSKVCVSVVVYSSVDRYPFAESISWPGMARPAGLILEGRLSIIGRVHALISGREQGISLA